MSRPNRLVLPLTVIAALSLTACQDDSKPASAAPPSRSSIPSSSPTPADEASKASPAADRTSARFLERMRSGMGRQGTAHLEMKVTGPAPSTSSGDMRYDGRGSELRLTTRTPKLGSGALEMVVLRDAAYVSIPGLVPAGKYVRLGKDNPRFQQLAGASIRLSPERSMKVFEAGLISVKERGRDTVQGAPTTAYDVRTDAAKALQAQGSEAVPGMPATLTYRVWLDAQDRMRRMALEVQGVKLSMELSRWGQPVDIEAPAESQLVKAPPGF